jgi:carbamate kinase
MLIVAALGGNALLRRGQPMTFENQRANARAAAQALAYVVLEGHRLVVTHGNGPQIGLLALQNLAYRPKEAYPLDVLGSETEGMIGYLIEQELLNALPPTARAATILTQIEVSPTDPAFGAPTKPIGPMYTYQEANALQRATGWTMGADGRGFRRLVPSPAPQRILELPAISQLMREGTVVICAGGGGIPVMRDENGSLSGAEAVIDKDSASALLACTLCADRLLLLTDVDGVYCNWGTDRQSRILHADPDSLTHLSLEPGSMGAKVEAACAFARSSGGIAVIGKLSDALGMIHGSAGTAVSCTYRDDS